MKKRIVCALLTLIMLLSLVPMGASAATHTASEAAITVLKQMTTFKSVCYHYSGMEFRTGYGTVCGEKHSFDANGLAQKKPAEVIGGKTVTYYDHPITELNADKALREALKALDTKVCAFETANKLSLKQNQHDALVLLSYLGGAGWMNGNGVLKSAVINKYSTTEMLNAIKTWSNNINTTRAQALVNMYQNGTYSINVPENFAVVTYDAGTNGSMPQHDADINSKYTYYYDMNTPVQHPVTPTRSDAIFVGWYANVSTGKPVWAPELNRIFKNHTLTALWQVNGNAVGVEYQLSKSQLAQITVFKGRHTVDDAMTEKMYKTLTNDGYIWVDMDFIDAKGVRWSHLKGYNDGWVKVGANNGNSSFTDNGGTVIATATVTVNGYLNLRQAAGTDSKIVGALAKNDTVNLYEIKTVNGHQWGRSKSGWLCLTYARVIMKNDANISDKGALTYAFTAKIVNGNVKAHVEAGSNTNQVTYTNHDKQIVKLEIPKDTAVTLTNLAVSNNETWAKAVWTNKEWKYDSNKKLVQNNVTRSGWVNLAVNNETSAYVQLDTVKYTTAADSVNVRSNWGDSASQAFTLKKDVEVEVLQIALVNENIWGRIKFKLGSQTGGSDEYGYVNLASKYFNRNTIPNVNLNQNPNLKKIATVINTDSLKVRSFGASYGTRIGALGRGTTVAVWEVNEDDWYKVDSNSTLR